MLGWVGSVSNPILGRDVPQVLSASAQARLRLRLPAPSPVTGALQPSSTSLQRLNTHSARSLCITAIAIMDAAVDLGDASKALELSRIRFQLM